MKKITKIFAALILGLTVGLASAQNFKPTKTIDVMTPWPVGGSNDVIARLTSEILEKHGWKSVTTNMAGAGGVIGMNHFAKAEPDGHNLMVVATASFNTGLVNDSTATYTAKSVVPVFPVVPSIQVLYASADAPFNNYAEFVAWAKQNPKKFDIGIFSAIMAPIYKKWAELEKLPEPNFIVYKGSGPVLTDVLGGHVKIAVDSISVPESHVKAGKLKIIGAFDPAGVDMANKFNPPATKAVWLNKNHPNFVLSSIFGVWAPAGTPDHIVRDLYLVLAKGFSDPEIQKRLGPLASAPFGGTREMLSENQQKVFNTMQSIVKK
jgi:tripartite-type tricarboxylate transporter receptor subunit TctC